MAESAARRERLAEHVAEGGSIRTFAKTEGVSERGVRAAWAKICAALGESANG